MCDLWWGKPCLLHNPCLWDRVLEAVRAGGQEGSKPRGRAEQGAGCTGGTHRGPLPRGAHASAGGREQRVCAGGTVGERRFRAYEGREWRARGGRCQGGGQRGPGGGSPGPCGHPGGTGEEGKHGGLPRAGPHPRGARSRREEWEGWQGTPGEFGGRARGAAAGPGGAAHGRLPPRATGPRGGPLPPPGESRRGPGRAGPAAGPQGRGTAVPDSPGRDPPAPPAAAPSPGRGRPCPSPLPPGRAAGGAPSPYLSLCVWLLLLGAAGPGHSCLSRWERSGSAATATIKQAMASLAASPTAERGWGAAGPGHLPARSGGRRGRAAEPQLREWRGIPADTDPPFSLPPRGGKKGAHGEGREFLMETLWKVTCRGVGGERDRRPPRLCCCFRARALRGRGGSRWLGEGQLPGLLF